MLDHRNAGNERIFVHHSKIDSIFFNANMFKTTAYSDNAHKTSANNLCYAKMI